MCKRTLAAIGLALCWFTAASALMPFTEPRFPREGEELTIHVGKTYSNGCYYVSDWSWSRSGNDFYIQMEVDHPWNHGIFVGCACVLTWVGVDLEVGPLEAGSYTINSCPFEVLPPGPEPPRVISGGPGHGSDDHIDLDRLPQTIPIEFSKPLDPATVNEQTFRIVKIVYGQEIPAEYAGLTLITPTVVHVELAKGTPNGDYRLIVAGDPDGLCVRDFDGTALDGERKTSVGDRGFPGYESWTAYPSGNRVPGGDFTLDIDIDVNYLTFEVSARYGSVPLEGITIAGDSGETLPYTFTITDYDSVNLVAPEFATVNGVEFRFKAWTCNWWHEDDRSIDSCAADLSTYLVSEWLLAGDTNNDGVINIIDLIAVREKLGKDPASAYWDVDANRDGVVNILDLVFVRNRLGARAPTQ